MASTFQTASITCRGGLDQTATTQELLQKPGFALTLENFEASEEGGYRRISGFNKYNTTIVPGTGDILGVIGYQGVVTCRGDGIFHSFDGITWTQVNRITGTPVNNAALLALALAARTSAGKYTFDVFAGLNVLDDDLIIRDPNNQMAILTITGSSIATATYDYNLITSGGISQAGIGTVFRNQHFATEDSDNPTNFFVSNTLDMDDFTTGTSGSFSIGEPITGIKSFRDGVYIFSVNSIFKGTGFDSGSPDIQPITRKIGCISHHTIQEVGGDVVFLAEDGIRNLSGTAAIGDIDLSTLSNEITPSIRSILSQVDISTLSSTVIRSRSQYRLFAHVPGTLASDQKGLVGTYFADPGAGNNSLIWGDVKGIDVTAIGTGTVDQQEVHFHGDAAGFVYNHDVGKDFDGTTIISTYQTPFFNLGDSGLRKALHDVVIYLRVEGDSNFDMSVLYEYGDPDFPQPAIYPISQLSGAALYGFAVYGVERYGVVGFPFERILTEGSGKVISLKFVTNTPSASYSIQGFETNFIPAGRI